MSEKKRLSAALATTILVFVLQFSASVWSQSVALMADSFHVLTDTLALSIALWASVAASRPPTARESFGYAKAKSSLAPFANGLFLGILGIITLLRAAEQWAAGEPRISLTPLAAGASAGLIGNVGTLLVLRRGEISENLRAAVAHVLADAATSIAVLSGAGLIAATGTIMWDRIAAVAIACWMLWNARRIIRRAAPELLDIAPIGFPMDRLTEAVRAVPDVLRIEHRPHVTGSGKRLSLTLHLTVTRECNFGEVYRCLHELFERDFDIRHSTVQLEAENSTCRKCVFEKTIRTKETPTP